MPGGGALETRLPGPSGPPTVTAAPGLGCELASGLMVTRLYADLKSLCLWMKQHLHGVTSAVLQEEGIRSEVGWGEGRKVRQALGPWKEVQERVQEGPRPPGLWLQPSLSACWPWCHHVTLPPPQEQGPRTPVWTLACMVGPGPGPAASRHHPPAEASRPSRAPSRVAAPWLDVRPD